MPFIKLTKVERKRAIVWFTCLFAALATWLFIALDRKYPYKVQTQLLYQDEPQKKAFKPLQPDEVMLEVEGSGWQLLFSKLHLQPQSIKVSLAKLSTQNHIIFSEQLEKINRQLGASQKIIGIEPDTLYFDFSKRTNKRVPLKLLSNLSFVKQYGISSKIRLTPSYVNISGPQDELDKINVWYTDTLRLSNLQKPTNTRIAIKKNRSTNISIYPTNVGVSLPIDEFTEKTLDVPVKVINNFDFYDIRLFPKKVAVTFTVALSNYQQVDEDFIEAVVDVNEWKQLGHHKFAVKLARFPDYCNLVKIVPNKLNFIIEK
ncbi:MAG: YbbR-like domain-containing protein [Pedobacter sp.]|nr:YbbR-like domain-containing protein [Pedobacter sp.]MDQ8053726.1 YbbR-like domain-containing protein [Pedobacter sp.]